MNKFENSIVEEILKGRSIEDISKELTEALNNAEKTTQKNSKERFVKELTNTLYTHFNDKNLTVKDAAIIATLRKNKPSWTDKDLKEFAKAVEFSINMLAELMDKDIKYLNNNYIEDLIKRWFE